MVSLHSAAFGDLDSLTLYRMLQLRVDVFIVEQQCFYPELDGRDVEPSARHLWAEHDGQVVACLRVLHDNPGRRIGRVCTMESARGRRLADRLLAAALEDIGPETVRLDAQVEARGLYERHGFYVDGPEYHEDGILHVPMRRDPAR